MNSYPHPWLMPDFWEFPTVSMGLDPIMAIESPPVYYNQNMQSHPDESQPIVQEMAAMSPLLSAPDDLTVYPSGADMVLRWSPSFSATAYDVYRLSSSEQDPHTGEFLGRTMETTMELPGKVLLQDRAFYVVIAVVEWEDAMKITFGTHFPRIGEVR